MSKYLDRPCRSLAEVLREREESTMLPMPERSPEELNEALRRRMDELVSTLQVIDGMTKRGAVLPADYQLPSVARYFARIWNALSCRRAVKNPWDKADAA